MGNPTVARKKPTLDCLFGLFIDTDSNAKSPTTPLCHSNYGLWHPKNPDSGI